MKRSSKSTRPRRPSQIAASVRREEARVLGARKRNGTLSPRIVMPRTECRWAASAVGSVSAFGKAANSARTPASVSIASGGAARRAPQRSREIRTLMTAPKTADFALHHFCSMVVTRFAVLGLAELIRDAIPT